jgi:hypothetical protein
VPDELVNVRYMVDDVDQAIDLFTTHFRLHAPHQPRPGVRRQRLRVAGLTFRNEIVTGPGGRQILVEDPSVTGCFDCLL